MQRWDNTYKMLQNFLQLKKAELMNIVDKHFLLQQKLHVSQKTFFFANTNYLVLEALLKTFQAYKEIKPSRLCKHKIFQQKVSQAIWSIANDTERMGFFWMNMESLEKTWESSCSALTEEN